MNPSFFCSVDLSRRKASTARSTKLVVAARLVTESVLLDPNLHNAVGDRAVSFIELLAQ